jgi:hypothetical protein
MRMPAADPEPGPEEFPAGAAGGPVPGWVPGVAESGSGPVPDPEPGGMPRPGLPAGLDYQALLEGLAASGRWMVTPVSRTRCWLTSSPRPRPRRPGRVPRWPPTSGGAPAAPRVLI